MNIMSLMQLKECWDAFKNNHPKFPMFLKAASSHSLEEGSVIEITVTPPDGTPLTTNLKLKATDLELLEQLKTSLK
jgi:hypothetical protein